MPGAYCRGVMGDQFQTVLGTEFSRHRILPAMAPFPRHNARFKRNASIRSGLVRILPPSTMLRSHKVLLRTLRLDERKARINILTSGAASEATVEDPNGFQLRH